MNIPVDPFEVISIKWISSYVDTLYSGYRQYGDPGQLTKDHKKYSGGGYDGSPFFIQWGKAPYVIFNPHSYETEKINDFEEFEKTRVELVKLRQLQLSLKSDELNQLERGELRRQVKNLFVEIFLYGKLLLFEGDRTNPVIALTYFYEGGTIERSKAGEIADYFGKNSSNSGQKLYQEFTNYEKDEFRLNTGDSKTKLGNRIKLIELVSDLLSAEGKKRAMNDLEILRKEYFAKYQ